MTTEGSTAERGERGRGGDREKGRRARNSSLSLPLITTLCSPRQRSLLILSHSQTTAMMITMKPTCERQREVGRERRRETEGGRERMRDRQRGKHRERER